MPGIDYRELRARISMREVLALLHFEPTQVRGAQWRGPCPLHDLSDAKDTPRRRTTTCFSVHLDKHVYRCFVCGSCGNQLDLWAAARHLSLYNAALDLCQAAQLTPSWLPASNSAPLNPQRPTRPPSCRESGPV
jgi:DNA primase